MEQDIKRAEQLYQDHRYEEALAIYKQAIRQSASNPDPRLYYGQAAVLERLAEQAHDTAHELGYPEVQQVNVAVDPERSLETEKLDEMSLTILAEYSSQEMNKYRHNQASDERYGLELFRRAVVQRDHEAWAILHRLLTDSLRSWLANHASREAALRHETEQDYIDHAFQRFWLAINDQALVFTSLANALHYLRLCLHCAIMDTIRAYTRMNSESLPEDERPNVPLIEDHYNENEFWEAIQDLLLNVRERRVAYLHFHCNLKPREIVRYCPSEFSSEEEVYRIKRNIMERIMRNIDKIRWRLGDTLV